ncbi:MAG: hypothetical protein ACE5EG_06030 [Thermoanaerobaculia bacterium]
MLELLALIGLFIAGLVALAILALIFGLLKLTFKLLLIPLSLAWGLLKVVVCCLVLLALVLAPAFIALLLVAVPVLALAGLIGIGWAAAAA